MWDLDTIKAMNSRRSREVRVRSQQSNLDRLANALINDFLGDCNRPDHLARSKDGNPVAISLVGIEEIKLELRLKAEECEQHGMPVPIPPAYGNTDYISIALAMALYRRGFYRDKNGYFVNEKQG